MRRLRAWWAPKEPVERAGIVGVILLAVALVIAAIEPGLAVSFLDSLKGHMTP